ncbi:hypothetical protein [Paenibacillus sanguinis]|uniref:hypothetical protein n=1 Tax=Paenibacillus sanguinis TaxID=225906 RepID=UPI0003717A9A|nr:hypothetical protein [Paenibacillus sanguinis]
MSTGDTDKPEKGQQPEKTGFEQQSKELLGRIRLDEGGLKVTAAVEHTVLIPVNSWLERTRKEVVEQLQQQPERIANLVEQGAVALLPLLPEHVPWLKEMEDASQDESLHAKSFHAGKGIAKTEAPGTAGVKAIGPGSERVAAGDNVASKAVRATHNRSEAVPAVQQPGWSGNARCSCSDPCCAWVAPAQAAVAAAWASGADERLRLLGWTREALLAAVWAAWAAAAPLADAEAALRRAAGPRTSERRPAAGPLGQTLAERLAEAAEQGRLHEPAPEFHDIHVELGPAEPAAAGEPQGPDPAPWAAMLPGVRGAATGLSLVAGQVMQRAEELAAPLRTKPR